MEKPVSKKRKPQNVQLLATLEIAGEKIKIKGHPRSISKRNLIVELDKTLKTIDEQE